jgi:hypothetical protein
MLHLLSKRYLGQKRLRRALSVPFLQETVPVSEYDVAPLLTRACLQPGTARMRPKAFQNEEPKTFWRATTIGPRMSDSPRLRLRYCRRAYSPRRPPVPHYAFGANFGARSQHQYPTLAGASVSTASKSQATGQGPYLDRVVFGSERSADVASEAVSEPKPVRKRRSRSASKAAGVVSETAAPTPARRRRSIQVRTRLPAGGRWIRTIGPSREGAGFCCGRRFASDRTGAAQKSLWGTDGSNPAPSTGESGCELDFRTHGSER